MFNKMIFINLHHHTDNSKVSTMSESFLNKKTRKAFYFIAITALTAIAFTFVIKEGQRIKMENELLSYEVW